MRDQVLLKAQRLVVVGFDKVLAVTGYYDGDGILTNDPELAFALTCGDAVQGFYASAISNFDEPGSFH